MPFTNPLVAGTTLIRSAIQSPNFVTGVSGWTINKDGTVEFTNGVFRGTVSADNGNITLNATGIHVVGTTRRFDITKSAGYIGQSVPANGQQVQLVDSGLFLTPPTPTVNGNVVNTSAIFAGVNTVATVDTPYLTVNGTPLNGKAAASVVLYGQTSNSAVDNSVMQLLASQVLPIDNTLQDQEHHYYLRGENGAFIRPVVAGFSFFSDPVTFTHPFAGTPNVMMNIQDGGGNTKTWMCRAISVSNTGFTSFFFQPAGTVAAGSSSVTITWVATEYTP